MTIHTLDLFENAVDSLVEALHKFREGENGDDKAYKFAVLHTTHFLELLLKHHVAKKHPLLIYTNPFSKKLDTAKTIALWDAVNFINNESEGALDQELIADLEWLKKLRNEIEHHKFEMDLENVRITMGRIYQAVKEFLESHSDIELEKHIPETVAETFNALADEYEFKRQAAIKEAEKYEDEHPVDYKDPDAKPPVLFCYECDSPTLVESEESSTGYICNFCGNEESDEIPANCNICGVSTTVGELVYWDNEQGISEARCYYCSGQYRMDKDD